MAGKKYFLRIHQFFYYLRQPLWIEYFLHPLSHFVVLKCCIGLGINRIYTTISINIKDTFFENTSLRDKA